MRLIYIVNVKLPTVKGYDVNVTKMCEAFGRHADVELIVPQRRATGDIFSYYNIEKTFTITRVYSLDLLDYVYWLGYWIQTLTFVVSALWHVSQYSRNDIRVYTREYLIAGMCHALGYRVVYECHRILSKKALFFWIVKDIPYIVTNSKGVAHEFESRGFPRVLAQPNGVTLEEFKSTESKDQLRERLSLPRAPFIVMYLGHLYAWKGADTILALAEACRSDEGIIFVCVGGLASDIEKYQALARGKKLDNIMYLGHVPKRDTPSYLMAADALLLPNSPVSEESISYTSPIKLFEYMASRRPVIASDLPSLREILSEEYALLVPPDDVPAFRDAVLKLKNDEYFGAELASRAYGLVTQYTWKRRAERIIQFISQS